MDYQGFVGSNYESQSVTADQEQTVNWFFERLEGQGATSRSALYPTPGVEAIVTAASGPGRAHFFMDSMEYAVIGMTFWEISQSGAMTNRGTVAIGTDPATISSNGDGGGQLFITSGTNGYCYDVTSHVFTQVTALNGSLDRQVPATENLGGKATMGDHLDGYFLALDAATSTLYISNLLDGLVWTTGTDFAQRSRAADPWVSMRVNGLYVWLFGEQSSEPWYNAGTTFPFAPYPSLIIPYGIAAPFSAAVSDGAISWLGATRIGQGEVLRATGFTPEIVSDYALNFAVSQYATLSDAVAESFNFLGHVFYLLNFPSENVTWAFDVREKRWFKWMTWISEDNEYVAWRPRWHAMAFNEHRMLDASTGAVYRMSADLPLDVDARPIRRTSVCSIRRSSWT